MFETVHTMPEWYDGPRRGIADFRGHPHLFESDWQDGANLDADTFLLTPIDDGLFALALEGWAIWRRWETAFKQGAVAEDSHPALPEDRDRFQAIERLLTNRLVGDPSRGFRQKAEFRFQADPQTNGYTMEVRWIEP